MTRRLLLVAGCGLIAAALILGAVGIATNGAGGSRLFSLPGGMMGFSGTTSASRTPISVKQAQSAVQAVLDQQGDRDLVIDELIEFQDNFYAIVKEKSTGTGAFELLVNRYSGAVTPEPGPNMMWNTRYRMMAGGASWVTGGGPGIMGGGMMGNGGFIGPMTVSAGQGRQIAQRWLDQNQPGSTTETPDTFYGYYTVHLRKDGRVTGMLSVNGYTGQVWYHSWHGAFIHEEDLGG